MTHGALQHGETATRLLSQGFGGVFATRAELVALPAARRVDGMVAVVSSDSSLWQYSSSSALTTDTAGELTQEPTDGAGCWLRADKSFIMKVPVAFGMADAAAAETIPEGFALRLGGHPYWEVTTAWTGGTNAAIGISTSLTGYDTKGDLLGGAGGDLLATLVAGIAAGTQGGELNDNVGFHALLLEEGSVIRYDEIVDAFTAGAGFACIPVLVARAPATP